MPSSEAPIKWAMPMGKAAPIAAEWMKSAMNPPIAAPTARIALRLSKPPKIAAKLAAPASKSAFGICCPAPRPPYPHDRACGSVDRTRLAPPGDATLEHASGAVRTPPAPPVTKLAAPKGLEHQPIAQNSFANRSQAKRPWISWPNDVGKNPRTMAVDLASLRNRTRRQLAVSRRPTQGKTPV